MTDGLYDHEWLVQFAAVTRTVTLHPDLRRNSCILTTRVGLGVLAHFGVKARAQAVQAAAYNPAAQQAIKQGTPFEQWPADAWSVGVGATGVTTAATKSWDGHLVIIVSNPNRKRTLIDLTADQMARPERGLDVHPILTILPSDWTPRDPHFANALPSDAPTPGAVVMYRPVLRAGDWQDAPDWASEHDLADQMIEHIIGILPPLPG